MNEEKLRDPDNIVRIKKYANRRLYSQTDGCFLTISDLEKLVRSGKKVRVYDSDSDQDITSEVLTQILLENGRAVHFPVEILEQMLRTSEKTMRTFWSEYFDQSVKFMNSFENNMKNLQKVGSFFMKDWSDAKAAEEPKTSSTKKAKKEPSL